LTNKSGGIIDDLIVTRLTDEKFYAVLNAGRKDEDLKWIRAHLPPSLSLDYNESQALLALQGPAAQKVMFDEFGLDLNDMEYMTGRHVDLNGAKAFVSRLGYTGEDGFELSVPGNKAVEIWKHMLLHEKVKPIGLAARDSLRLEMGYCLYGHDIDENTTPVEADLQWVIGKVNRDFIGAGPVWQQVENGAIRKRVGIKLLDKGVAREGTVLRDEIGNDIGQMTSGGFSPTLKASIGQGYVDAAHAVPGTKIMAVVRGRTIPAEVGAMPFLQAKTKAAKAA
jgi:aminomethyltransferase